MCDAEAVQDGPGRGGVQLRSRRPERDEPPGPAAASATGFAAWLRRFVARYGWRAYALPVLTALTVVALMTTVGRPSHPPALPGPVVAGGTSPPAAPMASGNSRLKVDQPGASAQNEALASDQLPAGAPYTQRGTGTFRVLPGTTRAVGTGTPERYTIEVENGVAGVDLTAFAARVDAVLDDPKSWTAQAGVALRRVDSGPVDFHLALTSAMTVRQLCGYQLHIETSCWAPDASRVVLNVARWVRGDAAYVGDVDAYHIYMINHETGHALGHSHAHGCLPNGMAAVMMQQTITLKAANGKVCSANPWPFPPGVPGTPGVEIPGT